MSRCLCTVADGEHRHHPGRVTLVTGRRPRYEEIAEHLRTLVAAGAPGDRLPSDTDLAAEFSVSRMTARQAVQVLESEGLLRREQGRGTFITAPPVPRVLGSPLSFTESMRLRGLEATSRIVDTTFETPSPEDVEALGVDPDETIPVLTRVRLADGTPMAIERAVLAPSVRTVLEEIAATGSLHAAFEAMGRIPTWARARVAARRATPGERRLLDLGSDAVLLTENRIIYDQNDDALEHTETLYAAERYAFNVVMTREVGE